MFPEYPSRTSSFSTSWPALGLRVIPVMDARKLLREAKASRKPKELPKFAQKLDDTSLRCVACNSVIKHYLLWEDHEQSDKHRRNIQLDVREDNTSKKPKIDQYAEGNISPPQSAMYIDIPKQEKFKSPSDREFENFMAEVAKLPAPGTLEPPTGSHDCADNRQETGGLKEEATSDDSEMEEELDEEHQALFISAAKHYVQRRKELMEPKGSVPEDIGEDLDWRLKGIK
jgi:hypothetical protein